MKSTNKTPNGTSYWSNNITATVTQLKAILGEPVFCDNDGSDKVNFEWNLETDNGDVFTVYDWKEYRPISEDEIIVWHIGGINGSVTIQAQSEVNAALTTPPKESTHITWWKGLSEEEQTKLCQKHFQGIPVESLMERSIKVMYHYENPETLKEATLKMLDEAKELNNNIGNFGAPTTTNTVTGGEVALSEEDINTILAALMLAKTRYNHIDNGGIFYDGAFKDIKSQNEYAQSFFNVECTVRRLAKQYRQIK